jgi:hypothetical protein
MHHQSDERNDEQQVNQAAGYVKRCKPQEPHHEQDDE